MSQMTQEEYIAILFADCGYEAGSQRRGWLAFRFNKRYADELTAEQKSQAIELLKQERGDS